MPDNTSSAFIIEALEAAKRQVQGLQAHLEGAASTLPQADDQDAWRTDDKFRDMAEYLERFWVRDLNRRIAQQKVRAKTGR